MGIIVRLTRVGRIKWQSRRIRKLKGRCYYCITLEFSMECEVLILVYFLSEVDNFDPSFSKYLFLSIYGLPRGTQMISNFLFVRMYYCYKKFTSTQPFILWYVYLIIKKFTYILCSTYIFKFMSINNFTANNIRSY